MPGLRPPAFRWRKIVSALHATPNLRSSLSPGKPPASWPVAVISPPQVQSLQPDHPNWSWHEYGMRVGFWRLKRMFDRLGIKPTVTLGYFTLAGWNATARGQGHAEQLEKPSSSHREIGGAR